MIVTITLILVGIALLIWRGKRRVDRRNSDQPETYTSSILQSFIDTLILIIGVALIISGVSIEIGPTTVVEDLVIFIVLLSVVMTWKGLKRKH